MKKTGIVLTFEKNFSGHRWNYIECLAQGARRAGLDPHLATTQSGLDELTRLLDGAPPVTTHVVKNESLTALNECANELQADRVVVPDGDRLALRLGIRNQWAGPATLCVLVMRRQAQPRTNRLLQICIDLTRRALFTRANWRPNVEILFLTSALDDNPPAALVPDPVTFTPDPEPPVTLDPSRFWYAIPGAIDARKNVDLVMNSLELSGARPFGLLLAGKHDPAVLTMVEATESSFPVIALDRRLSEGELDAVVRAADCLVLAYSNWAPSGLVAKAAAAGTRVVLSESPTFIEDCRRLSPGAVTTPLETAKLSAALLTIQDRPRPEPMTLDAQAFVDKLLGLTR